MDRGRLDRDDGLTVTGRRDLERADARDLQGRPDAVVTDGA